MKEIKMNEIKTTKSFNGGSLDLDVDEERSKVR